MIEIWRRRHKWSARRIAHELATRDRLKVGQIPDVGGWRIHARGSQQVLGGKRARKQAQVGYTHLHTLEDGFSRLSYTEPLERYQRTLAQECLYPHEYESEAQRPEQIAI